MRIPSWRTILLFPVCFRTLNKKDRYISLDFTATYRGRPRRQSTLTSESEDPRRRRSPRLTSAYWQCWDWEGRRAGTRCTWKDSDSRTSCGCVADRSRWGTGKTGFRYGRSTRLGSTGMKYSWTWFGCPSLPPGYLGLCLLLEHLVNDTFTVERLVIWSNGVRPQAELGGPRRLA